MNAPESVPDVLYLWWLGTPQMPRMVGELRIVRSSRGVSLRYARSWLETGFALSEDLPLISGEHLPGTAQTAAGAVDDARPDRWGERVIRVLDKPQRLAILDFLYFAGDERFGALGVSQSPERYTPHPRGPLPVLADVADIARLIQQILAGEPVDARQRRLILPGASLGGARPKALVALEDHSWVLKFSEPGETLDMPAVEHAAMTLATQAGITVASTRLVPLPRGHAVAVRRFDREPGRRRHALSANVVLRAAGEVLGYPELAQWLRRMGDAGADKASRQELFRRMVFNILIDNTDDHEKNHAVLRLDHGRYALSPAFDVLPAGQALGFQQMRVGTEGHDATIDNAMSESSQFGLTSIQAKAIAAEVARAVDGWRPHFARSGVSANDIALLETQIDRPFLKTQRQALLGTGITRGAAG